MNQRFVYKLSHHLFGTMPGSSQTRVQAGEFQIGRVANCVFEGLGAPDIAFRGQ